jgi:hypothetical protein
MTDDKRKSSQISFAKLEPSRKDKKLKLSDREDALPDIPWSPQRPRPVNCFLHFFTFPSDGSDG